MPGVIIALQILLQYGPQAYMIAANLLSKTTPPTPDEWAALSAIVNRPLHDPTVGPAVTPVVPVVPTVTSLHG